MKRKKSCFLRKGLRERGVHLVKSAELIFLSSTRVALTSVSLDRLTNIGQ